MNAGLGILATKESSGGGTAMGIVIVLYLIVSSGDLSLGRLSQTE